MNLIATLPITPCPAPRQQRSDAWKPRNCVVRYRAFRDTVRGALGSNYELPESTCLVFWIPMPKSWSYKKKWETTTSPHQQKPDVDNLVKAVLDSIYRDGDDSHVWDVRGVKLWGFEGKIEIYEMESIWASQAS